MLPLPTVWIAAAALAAGAAGGYTVATKVGEIKTERAKARLMQCEQMRAIDASIAAEKTAVLLARAREAEGAAAAQLSIERAAYERKLKEIRHEVRQHSTGRQCLSGALRLRLNSAIASADDLPKGAGDAHPAPAESSTDPGLHGRGEGWEGTNDADLASWILDAARLYEDCRARIDAIRTWDEVTHGR